MVTLLLTPQIKTYHYGFSYTNTPLAEDKVRDQEGRSVVRGEGERLCLPVKVFWVSDTLKTAVRY